MTTPQPVILRGWPNSKGRSDPSRDRFRQNLSRIMAEQGITQASLARTMEVSRVAVHAWIWGTCFPETSRLIKLAQTLNVTVGDLLESDGTAQPASSETSNEEALLLNAFRKLPNTARLSLLADAYEMSAQASLAAGETKTGPNKPA
ncbi:MAG TPA: helix-turn-helix transcriptional regulator [Acetobacteraceae bacterium]|nr:helix-turn-helix transcriptional regulator [Acetobacteraceae bacterium]